MDREWLRRNSKIILTVLVFAAVLAVILVLNFHTDYTSDDFKYRFVYDTPGNPHEATRPIQSPWDIGISMMNHWKMCNGRLVAHGLLQAVLPFGKIVFRIINSLVYMLLMLLIYKHANYGKGANPLLALFIGILMWFFLPQFGMTVLWASGAANYLWCSVLILAFLLPYRMYAHNPEAVKDSAKNMLLMGLFGLFAGCTNENTGGGAVLVCLLFLALYRLNGIKIPRWAVSGIVTGIAGAAVLISAPGNYRISSAADFSELVRRFTEIMDVSWTLLGKLLLILCIVAIICLLSREKRPDRRKDLLLPAIYLVMAAAMICVLVFSAMHPERTWFASTVMIIAVTGYAFSGIQPVFARPGKNAAAAVAVAAVMLCCFGLSFGKEFPLVNSTYAQVMEGVDAIEEAVKSNEASVRIPIPVPSQSKYDAYNGTGYVKEPADDWMNAWMAEYYGIPAIEGYVQ